MATKRYIVNGTLQTTLTPDNVSTQKVKVDKGGTLVGTRQEINLIEGSNVTLTVADNSGSDRVDVTVAAAATPPTNMASKTTADLTYYVDSDVGSDSNDGLAAGVGHAFLTIQKAVDSIPDVVNHLVTINLASCTAKYAGFYMQNKLLGSKVAQGTNYTITIQGEYKAATKQGTMSGTMDSGTTKVITDADAGWLDDMRGLVVYVNSTYYLIRSNTASTIEIVGVHGTSLSGAYVIYDFGSVINTNISHNGYYASVGIRNCKGPRGFYSAVKLSKMSVTPPDSGGSVQGISAPGSDVFLDHVSVNLSSLTTVTNHAGINIIDACNVRIEDCFSGNCTVGTASAAITVSQVTVIRALSRTLAYGCPWGINILGLGTFIQEFNNVHADNNSVYGILLQRFRDIIAGSCYINGNVTTNTNTLGLYCHSVTGTIVLTAGTIESNKHGILIGASDPTATVIEPYGVGSYILRGSIIVRNNTVSALSVVGNQLVKVSTMTGANATTGAYGIYVREGAKVFITSGTTVSGDTGKDVYMDGTSFTYAADFAANGDAVVNTELATVVKRIDG